MQSQLATWSLCHVDEKYETGDKSIVFSSRFMQVRSKKETDLSLSIIFYRNTSTLFRTVICLGEAEHPGCVAESTQ